MLWHAGPLCDGGETDNRMEKSFWALKRSLLKNALKNQQCLKEFISFLNACIRKVMFTSTFSIRVFCTYNKSPMAIDRATSFSSSLLRINDLPSERKMKVWQVCEFHPQGLLVTRKLREHEAWDLKRALNSFQWCPRGAAANHLVGSFSSFPWANHTTQETGDIYISVHGA